MRLKSPKSVSTIKGLNAYDSVVKSVFGYNNSLRRYNVYHQKNNVPPTPKGVGLLQALVFRMLRNENHLLKEMVFISDIRKYFHKSGPATI